ncbi:hypothetical protein Tco_0393395 [Tanacetum coccineum]
MTKRHSKEVETTRMVKVIGSALYAETQIILSENVRNHRKKRTKGLSSKVLGVIAVKKKMKRSKTKCVSWLKHLVRDKSGLGFSSFEASTSGTKKTEFVESQNKTSPGGGPLIVDGGPTSPRPKHIMVNNVKIHVASDDDVKRLYKPSLKPGVGFSKPHFRSKTPPPMKINNPRPRSRTLQPKRNLERQNRPNGFLICHGVNLEPDEWIKYNGCSKHMTGNRKLFSSYKAYNGGNVIFIVIYAVTSLAKVLSYNKLKINGGFERAFETLFEQDVQTFTCSMLLNLDQLEKQLGKEEFQETESMDAFRALKTQFQLLINF